MLYYVLFIKAFADVMELADVTDSKSVGSDTVWVRVPPSAPKRAVFQTALNYVRKHAKTVYFKAYSVFIKLVELT